LTYESPALPLSYSAAASKVTEPGSGRQPPQIGLVTMQEHIPLRVNAIAGVRHHCRRGHLLLIGPAERGMPTRRADPPERPDAVRCVGSSVVPQLVRRPRAEPLSRTGPRADGHRLDTAEALDGGQRLSWRDPIAVFVRS